MSEVTNSDLVLSLLKKNFVLEEGIEELERRNKAQGERITILTGYLQDIQQALKCDVHFISMADIIRRKIAAERKGRA